MNKPIHPVISSDDGSPAYEADAYGWARAQADFIRSGRLEQIDWDNIAEEIDDVATSERRTAESALRIIMMHILKWQMQPERRGRSWALSIAGQRLAYEQILDENPSLKAEADDIREKAFRRARIEAAREMDLPLRTVPEEAPAWDVVLGQPFDVD